MSERLQQYFDAIGQRESGGNYKVVNTVGYLGKYQMGKSALIDAGYYAAGKFTGKDGVYSKEDFLNNPQAQENAMRIYKQKQWGYIKGFAPKYSGKYINGIHITYSGMLAAAHLNGQAKLNEYLTSGGKLKAKDGYGTSIEEYLEKFSDYDVSEITGLADDSDGRHNTQTTKANTKTKKDEHKNESVKSEKEKQNNIKQEKENEKDDKKDDISLELADLSAALAGGAVLSPAMMFSNLIRLAAKNRKNKIFEDIFQRHLRFKNEAETEKYKNYKNPETGENKIYTKEAIDKMSDSEYQKHKKAITAQKLRIGIPTHKEMENVSKSGGGVVFVSDYTRGDGTHVSSYWRSAPH